MPAAAEMLLAMQAFVTRRIPVQDPPASNSLARNVIPGEIDLNIRTLCAQTSYTLTALAAGGHLPAL